jgi:hypothetical protein
MKKPPSGKPTGRLRSLKRRRLSHGANLLKQLLCGLDVIWLAELASFVLDAYEACIARNIPVHPQTKNHPVDKPPGGYDL